MSPYRGRGGGGCSVADHGQKNGGEPLTQRDRELIKELAREVVREARLVRDPKEETDKQRIEVVIDALRYNTEKQLDFFKHMTTLSSASIVGATAIIGAFFSNSKHLWWPIYASLAVLAITLLLCGAVFARLTGNTGGVTCSA
jgi:hypothetical protein